MPVGFSLLRLLPIPTKLRSRFYAYFIDPPAWGRKHSVPVLGLGFIPTRGQMIFILYLIAINVAALMRHMGNRAGAVAFANIPLVILYGGRNSLLLWLTNWSHSTFLLLHRWVATMLTLQVCFHSLMWLRIMIEAHSHSEASKLPYWYWGIIGTLSFSLLIPLSVYYLRKIMYEVFLIGHIFLAIMAIVGSWYHIWYLYSGSGGFDIWLYIAISIWSFDRFLRIVRVSKHGIKRAYVTRVTTSTSELMSPASTATATVTLTSLPCPGACGRTTPSRWLDATLATPGPTRRRLHTPTVRNRPCLRLYPVSDPAAKEAGFISRTRTIATRNGQHGITFFAGVEAGIPVLIEGTYGHEGKTYLQGNQGHFAPTPEYPNILCIAGGVGVTAVLPALNSSLSLYAPMGTTKLYWGIRNRGLVDAVQNMLVGAGEITDSKWGHIEPHITVGSRMNVRQVLEEELEHAVGGTTVVACGPLAMCDDVRYTCAALARHGTVVRYLEEACTW
ncbi:hypothetical protein NM208_g6108 [Fusarium decemcellulare]|uniref:Uncharacterized protein n=1 Tax=Fusarium decemcellulare TaxID=57161 RepID=A0ACC1SEC9_9HYPO|nr:hypothetical protein NM208_g6108 [Fusarium decemcellulare]